MALPTTGADGPSRGQGSSHSADLELLACLQRYPLFNLLTPFQLATWIGAGQELTLATGETIFQKGAAVQSSLRESYCDSRRAVTC
jgi:hypothetical protein